MLLLYVNGVNDSNGVEAWRRGPGAAVLRSSRRSADVQSEFSLRLAGLCLREGCGRVRPGQYGFRDVFLS